MGRRFSASTSALRRSPTAQGGPTPPGGWFPPQRWAELNFPRVSKSASPTPYTFDTLVTGMVLTTCTGTGMSGLARLLLSASSSPHSKQPLVCTRVLTRPRGLLPSPLGAPHLTPGSTLHTLLLTHTNTYTHTLSHKCKVHLIKNKIIINTNSNLLLTGTISQSNF